MAPPQRTLGLEYSYGQVQQFQKGAILANICESRHVMLLRNMKNIPTRQPEETYSISDLACEFDVTPRAIRFYEDMGLLTPELFELHDREAVGVVEHVHEKSLLQQDMGRRAAAFKPMPLLATQGAPCSRRRNSVPSPVARSSLWKCSQVQS